MSIDKNLLKKFTLLYVEDDDVIRVELSQLLSNFFSMVHVAKNGKEGLRTFLENQDEIDLILTDLNMPELNGIEMIKKIRTIDNKIPIIFATAHSDSEFLAEAIKLRVQEYIVKPIDVRYLLSLFNDIVSNLYQEFLLKQQREELEKYKEIINSNNIVIKTDTHLNITYVNELFCEISGFNSEELIGKELKYLKYQDMASDIYTNLYVNILNNKSWQGKLKNIKKVQSLCRGWLYRQRWKRIVEEYIRLNKFSMPSKNTPRYAEVRNMYWERLKKRLKTAKIILESIGREEK